MKKITPSAIRTAIVEEAIKLKRKKELYESVVSINKELKQLNEVSWVGSFGFQAPSDNSNKTKTGFVNDFQNISHIVELEREMKSEEEVAPIKEDVLDEVAKLKAEIESLKKENEALKSKK
ncbi:MAG: hypothetical protein KatS3mg035_1150 [Bacteroidia bacterium]|nr:MAG: hypothetical protein KatS3mg035_1150 [Bacteroidia bacterium]